MVRTDRMSEMRYKRYFSAANSKWIVKYAGICRH
jgi:hypothetical protein